MCHAYEGERSAIGDAPTPPPQAKREHDWTDSDGNSWLVCFDAKDGWVAMCTRSPAWPGTNPPFDYGAPELAAEIAKLAGLVPPEDPKP